MPIFFIIIPRWVTELFPLKELMFLFAILNCIFTCFAILASIVWLLLGLITGYIGPEYFGQPAHIIASVGLGAIVFFIVSFVFSIILARGLFQKSPALVKAYLLYGLVVFLFCFVIGCFLMKTPTGETDDHYHQVLLYKAGIGFFLGSMSYSCILMMTWKMYRRLLVAKQFEQQGAELH